MIREASAMKVRKNLGELLNEVQYRRNSVLVTKGGKPVAALVDIGLFEKIRLLDKEFDRLTAELTKAYKGVDPATAGKRPGEYCGGLAGRTIRIGSVRAPARRNRTSPFVSEDPGPSRMGQGRDRQFSAPPLLQDRCSGYHPGERKSASRSGGRSGVRHLAGIRSGLPSERRRRPARPARQIPYPDARPVFPPLLVGPNYPRSVAALLRVAGRGCIPCRDRGVL